MYKKFINGKKVVCFDLDGTIVDNEGFYVEAFETVLEQANPELMLSDVYGKTGESLYQKWEKIADANLIKNKMSAKDLADYTYKEYMKIVSEIEIEPREGFWQLAAYLKEKGLQLALTTNTDKNIAQFMLNKLQVQDAFDFMIFGDEVKHKKPDPEIYKATAKHFKVKTNEMLVFEDSIAGAKAAADAGASLIVIWDGQTLKSKYPDKTIVFTDDFDGFAYNMDLNGEEFLEEIQKAMPPLQNPQTQK